jgi:hypothetical protein
MQAFEIQRQIIDDYKEHLSSFNIINDAIIKEALGEMKFSQNWLAEIHRKMHNMIRGYLNADNLMELNCRMKS